MELSGGVRVVGALAGRREPASTPLPLSAWGRGRRQSGVRVGWVGWVVVARGAAWYGGVAS